VIYAYDINDMVIAIGKRWSCNNCFSFIINRCYVGYEPSVCDVKHLKCLKKLYNLKFAIYVCIYWNIVYSYVSCFCIPHFEAKVHLRFKLHLAHA